MKAWAEPITISTYLPAEPDKNPMFLEKRVYQGSSGKVYPLPFIDRIDEKPVERIWQALHIENQYLRIMILPEMGGRIHLILDKTNGYDLIYRQDVIKPALVGLAGPWVSGGIEFNWPQHHRPATFLPTAWEIEERADGSRTIWCSDHDPLSRLKGMHGVCLHPDRAVLELKVRAYNRTPYLQTFLWWANVATRVHEGYQSFFPPDVTYVADHARRSTSSYPLAEGVYYGVNYGERGRKGIPPSEVPSQFVPPHCRDADDAPSLIPHYRPNDLSFYANICTPCSYMCMGSEEDFFGGYDYTAQAGIVHVASHHISPGKKQWTWGNHDFGYAWDRNLTVPDQKNEYGPYIEIMAGVYTDNQPDFSFIEPGETRTWSQYWYPVQKIGPAQKANVHAAVSLQHRPTKERPAATIGICVTRAYPGATIELRGGGQTLLHETADLVPGVPWATEISVTQKATKTLLKLTVLDQSGVEIISYEEKPRKESEVPPPAAEPLPPAEIGSVDELYLTGVHLEQYRHATRCPTLYWREAIKRDALDSRCNNAMGKWHFHRGEFELAEQHYRKAIARLTQRNANPIDGEAYYNLGICLQFQANTNPDQAIATTQREQAYAALYKATWNQSWSSASHHALAEIASQQRDWQAALDHLDRSLRLNVDNLRARNLKAMVLARLGRISESKALITQTHEIDRLDWWSRWLGGEQIQCDLQAKLDLAHDLARAGFFTEAIAVLSTDAPTQPWIDQSLGAKPLVEYTLGWLHAKLGDAQQAIAHFKQAAAIAPDYCFPARLEEIAILQAAQKSNRDDARALYYLGNLFYDRRRHREAIACWERAAKRDPAFSIVWRNLGIAYFNIEAKPARALRAYERAIGANPSDARLLFERDQLWKRAGTKPGKRLRELQNHPHLISQRDDLIIEYCALLNQTGKHEEALKVVSTRHFQPWEGGEGGPLGQHVRTHLILGRKVLAEGDATAAVNHFTLALQSPLNLGEARHILANQSDVHYWLGVALHTKEDRKDAERHWKHAAEFKGDFQQMSVRAFSEMTYYSALSLQRLGREAAAKKLLNQLLDYGRELAEAEVKIDYFATSLPTMLLFDDDLKYRQETTAKFLQTQALWGLGKQKKAKALLAEVLKRDPNHALAADLAQETISAEGE